MQDTIMTSPSPPNALTPNWLAHRFDPSHDSVQFIEVDRSTRARVPFLTDESLGKREPYIVRRDAVNVQPKASSPIRYIFHSAYCCSTLLANAYDRPGLSFSLKEPVILNDLVGWRHRGAEPAQVGAVLVDALALLARPFKPGELCIIKPSNVVNGLARAMLGVRNDSKALLLHAPLPAYLSSIASKGLWGRLWVRDLLAKQLIDGPSGFGFTPQDYFLQTDLQVAAVGWLAQHALFAQIATTWPERVRTIDSDTLLAHPADALLALDLFFNVQDNEDGRAAIIDRAFTRNSKSGEVFNASNRSDEQAASRATYGDEIDKVLTWAKTITDGVGLSFELPAPLIPHPEL